MLTVEKTEKEVLEGNLDKALAEAERKTGKALESIANKTEDSEKDLWAAAEAAEFASLVYTLTHSLEDSSGNTTTRRDSEETSTVVKEASQNLKTVQELRKQRDKDRLLEGYKLLRRTTDALRNAYLTLSKTKTKQHATN